MLLLLLLSHFSHVQVCVTLGTKKPLDESERGEWKSRLKAQYSESEDHGIWSHHFMGNIWGNSGNSVRLHLGGAPKSLQMVIAARNLKDPTSWRKVMTNLDCTLKSRDITLPKKVCLVKAMVFPVVMYGCESWTVKEAEHWRIDAFELWCWRRLLRVPWTARRSNQSILKEISPGCSLEGLMLKLKPQYFGHLMGRVDSLEKTLMQKGLGARREGDGRGWDGWMASPTQWTWVWVNSGSWWWTGRPGVLQFMRSQRVRHDWATELTDEILHSCLRILFVRVECFRRKDDGERLNEPN